MILKSYFVKSSKSTFTLNDVKSILKYFLYQALNTVLNSFSVLTFWFVYQATSRRMAFSITLFWLSFENKNKSIWNLLTGQIQSCLLDRNVLILLVVIDHDLGVNQLKSSQQGIDSVSANENYRALEITQLRSANGNTLYNLGDLCEVTC